MLERHVELIVMDAGGVQKEAYFHQVPCVTLRDETEWVELVELGWNHLASPDGEELTSILQRRFEAGNLDKSPYGDGHASTKIVSAIMQFAEH
ncbi:UDP-N-acetyl glucosamine 2-epimerase [Methylobacillus caricis]|uniref:UDP-N-acetylglucosamine 2-epimerase n=1 Tax=Methylobacillus caricis TaxID=1971611 RepID=UPI001D00089B|nr:UDP-N-acetylglucosamine 2-epimerase [Methylobacillus caricis]MCB5187690.1 UDP-N-acetyl glucosamine 2-epimerase [Methylobacillus caricis]